MILYTREYMDDSKNWFMYYQHKIQQGLEVWKIVSFIETLKEQIVSNNYTLQVFNEL
jgi:hypothetical protein